MGWERRPRGGRYYTRSRKVGGRVAREYIGGGRMGELAARQDDREREERRVAAEAWATERARLEVHDQPLADFCVLVEAVTRGALALAGYHRHDRGAWRKRRERDKDGAAPIVEPGA